MTNQLMSNPFQVFNNPAFGFVRVVVRDGEPWFVGKDVAEVLGYKDPDQALRKNIEEDDKDLFKSVHETVLNFDIPNRGLIIINESGLYSLMLRSKLPQAKEFKRWVTSEILPSIRKHGAYFTPDKLLEVLQQPDSLIQLLLELKEERKRSSRLQQDVDCLQERIDDTTFACLSRHRTKATAKDLLITEVAKMYDIKRKDFYKLLYDEGWLDNNNVDRKYYPTGKVPQGAMYVEVGAYLGSPKFTVRVTSYGLKCLKQLLRTKGYVM